MPIVSLRPQAAANFPGAKSALRAVRRYSFDSAHAARSASPNQRSLWMVGSLIARTISHDEIENGPEVALEAASIFTE